MERCLACLLLVLVACSDATGQARGGQQLLQVESGGACSDPSQHRWQDLYACYFGPAAKASCTAQNSCHGAADQPGAQASGFTCAATRDSCWRGITAKIVPPGAAQDPTSSALYLALRKSDGTGTMPKGSAFVFQPSDLDRIAAWIKDGAKDD